MIENPVSWFEIYVNNITRAKNFYEHVFQNKLEKISMPDLDMWAFPSSTTSAGCSGALIEYKGFSAGGNSVLVYFNCEDCAIEQERVLTFGGKIQQEKASIGENGFISLVIDTEGNMFGLHSQK